MLSLRVSALIALVSGAALSACSSHEIQTPPTQASAPVFARPGAEGAPGAGTTAPAPVPVPAANASAAGADSNATSPAVANGAEPGTTQPAADSAASGSAAAPEPSGPLPEVDIKNIGMHIGGGPNDAAAHAPIRDAVKPAFDAFRACYGLAEEVKKGATYGVDLLIPGAGGAAQITKPRSGIKGQAFMECMLAAFAKVEFKRPPRGVAQKVSYSIRFDKKK